MTDVPSILQAIQKAYPDIYLEKPSLPLPHKPKGQLKAFVLGTDPSTTEHQTLDIVFGLEKDLTYFEAILKNLRLLGLDMKSVFIENVCRNYFTVETWYNKHWVDAARSYWIAPLKEELDMLDPSMTVPVFATAEIIIQALVLDNRSVKTAEDLYEDKRIFTASENMLGRTLIPLFRHYAYSLSDWPEYTEAIREALDLPD